MNEDYQVNPNVVDTSSAKQQGYLGDCLLFKGRADGVHIPPNDSCANYCGLRSGNREGIIVLPQCASSVEYVCIFNQQLPAGATLQES